MADLTKFSNWLMRYGFDEGDPITDWVNAGLNEIRNAAEWPFLRELQSGITLAIGATSLALPPDFGKPIDVVDTTDDIAGSTGGRQDLEFYDPRKYHREIKQTVTPRALPEIYTQIGSSLIVWPPPSTARTFDLFYMKDDSDLALPGDTPDWLPVRWHYSPCVFAMAHIALMAENEEDRSTTALTEQNASLERMMNWYGLGQLGTPEAVEDVQGYFESASGG